MLGTQPEVVRTLRSLALQGGKPSEMVQAIRARHGPESPSRAVFFQYFTEAFCFSEGEASPLYGWLPDGTGELTDANLDELMARRIARNRQAWEFTE